MSEKPPFTVTAELLSYDPFKPIGYRHEQRRDPKWLWLRHKTITIPVYDHKVEFVWKPTGIEPPEGSTFTTHELRRRP